MVAIKILHRAATALAAEIDIPRLGQRDRAAGRWRWRSFGEGLPALDHDAGDRIDDEGEDEEHQAGGDIGAGLLGRVEFTGAKRDLEAKSLAAVEKAEGVVGAVVASDEIKIITATVSPSARPRPSIAAGDDAGLAKGQHRRANHLPLRAPSASAPSLCVVGVCAEDLARAP